MEHEAPAIFVALEHSGFAAAIRQSTWLYPCANVGHIVALVCFAGALAVMDLGLIGVLAAPRQLIARARRVAMIAFCALAVTGFMLFSAEASHIVRNPVFLIKMALVAAGLVNVAIYQLGARRALDALAPGAVVPRRVRVAGFVSLGIWLTVAAFGRSIAYY
jgi:hypothetical protein